MSKTRAVIIGGSLQMIPPNLKARLKDTDFIICADRGLEYALQNGIQPDLILGDFDSTEPPVEFLGEILRLPCKKDDTDLQFAAKEGLCRGYCDFLLTGVTGGRLDHTTAAIMTLHFLKQNGANAVISDREATIYLTERELTLAKPQEDCYFSVFPYGGVAKGVTITGGVYPLQGADLSLDFPIGVSNEFAHETVTVSVERGTCLIMVVPKI